MTKTEKAALQESVVQVAVALVINFPLQTLYVMVNDRKMAMGKCFSYLFNNNFYNDSCSIN
jgi:hypothetical protein